MAVAGYRDPGFPLEGITMLELELSTNDPGLSPNFQAKIADDRIICRRYCVVDYGVSAGLLVGDSRSRSSQ